MASQMFHYDEAMTDLVLAARRERLSMDPVALDFGGLVEALDAALGERVLANFDDYRVLARRDATGVERLRSSLRDEPLLLAEREVHYASENPDGMRIERPTYAGTGIAAACAARISRSRAPTSR